MTSVQCTGAKPIDPFILNLSVAMSGDASAAEYTQRQEKLLVNLSLFETAPEITGEAAYQNARAVKSALSSLFCYTANCNHAEFDRVSRLEGVWGRALSRYNQRFRLKDSDDVLIANYLLWSHRFNRLPHRAVVEEANRRGFLRKRNNALLVIGLEKKVGDNCFTVDRMEREHRQYVRTIGRQAFWVRGGSEAREIEEDAAFMATVPDLPEDYKTTSVGDGKHYARTPRITLKQRARLHELFKLEVKAWG